jgi:hypothetical protein
MALAAINDGLVCLQFSPKLSHIHIRNSTTTLKILFSYAPEFGLEL